VDLLGGRGAACNPTPGRIFLVGSSHSFEQFAEAIDAAFARWDLSHLHNFELGDGRLIGYPDDSFAPEMVWLDHAKLKVAKEVKLGEEFEYVFDLGDNWQHRCVVEPEKGDPLEEYGIVPEGPVAIWGWGSIPDQYGVAASTTAARTDQASVSLRWQTTAQPSSMNAMCRPGSRS
jgi:hypothetical protein